MDKILLAVGALALGIGLLFTTRTARGDEIMGSLSRDNFARNRPGRSDIEEAPIEQGASPSGLRINNPFNLKYFSIGWRGETGQGGKDNLFSVFDTPENGIRAGMINIHTKMTRDGDNTVRKLITRLSPAFENPTEGFISFVAGRLAVAPDQPITWRPNIFALSKAIIHFENGKQPYSDDQLNEAIAATGRG